MALAPNLWYLKKGNYVLQMYTCGQRSYYIGSCGVIYTKLASYNVISSVGLKMKKTKQQSILTNKIKVETSREIERHNGEVSRKASTQVQHQQQHKPTL